MKRIALTIVFLIATATSAQFSVTGSWQPASFDLTWAPNSRDIHLNTYAAGVEVGLFDRLSVSFEAGGGVAEIPGWGIDGSLDRFWRLAIQGSLWQHGPWSVGIGADVRQWQADDSGFLAGHEFGTRLALFAYRLRPTLSWTSDPIKVYGGPTVLWPDGDVTLYWGSEEPMSIHTEAQFGGFLGVQWQVAPHLTLRAEGEATESGAAAVLGLAVAL